MFLSPEDDPIGGHEDVVTPRNRFPPVTFRGVAWDLRHLDPFAFRCDVGPDGSPHLVDVVVLFSCHCFTRGDGHDSALASDYYDDGHEVRVLCEERYKLSREFLPRLVRELGERHIRVASSRPNFVTLELLGVQGVPGGHYGLFFEVERDKRRGKRLVLRVQSAYRLDVVPKRLREAGKVRLLTLLRATYEGRKIKG